MIAMNGYRLFHKNKQGRKGRKVTLCVKENLEHIEVTYIDGGSPNESLWVKIRGVISKEDLTVSNCYRPPNQDDKAN